jgi:hypothetical protein
MLPLATDWATISSLATAAGTLVLAVATFASVRSANRSARIAEIALQEQRRPLLTSSRLEDPTQKIMFFERHWVQAQGSRGVADFVRGNIYLALSLRNAGSGIAVCQGWAAHAGALSISDVPQHAPLESFRAQTRDLFIPANDLGMWQGAIRSPSDPDYGPLVEAIERREPITIELLYSDQVGGQRTVSRFGLQPWPDETWFAQGIRHWFLEGPAPRDEAAALARAEQILSEFAHQDEQGDGDPMQPGARAEAGPEAGAEPRAERQDRDYASSSGAPSEPGSEESSTPSPWSSG